MEEKRKNAALTKLSLSREKYLPYNRETLRNLAVIITVMYALIIIWALVFKLGREDMLIRNYNNLKDMTYTERIMWDLIPFNYRGTDYWKSQQVIATILNCFVFVPFGIAFCYIFKKQNAWRDAAICLGISVVVEMTQLFTILGNPATEDLITNVAGCFIGFAIYHIILKRLSEKTGVWLLTVTSVCLSAAVIYSLVTTVMAAETIFKIVTRTL
jgi:glycopeptide antibiotics resistance protein